MTSAAMLVAMVPVAVMTVMVISPVVSIVSVPAVVAVPAIVGCRSVVISVSFAVVTTDNGSRDSANGNSSYPLASISGLSGARLCDAERQCSSNQSEISYSEHILTPFLAARRLIRR